MEYANRVIANLNKRLMSMPKRNKSLKMIEVERFGTTMKFAEDKYEEYIKLTDQEKDSFFLDIVNVISVPTDPIEIKYCMERC